jgi:hypothetical protein
MLTDSNMTIPPVMEITEDEFIAAYNRVNEYTSRLPASGVQEGSSGFSGNTVYNSGPPVAYAGSGGPIEYPGTTGPVGGPSGPVIQQEQDWDDDSNESEELWSENVREPDRLLYTLNDTTTTWTAGDLSNSSSDARINVRLDDTTFSMAGHTQYPVSFNFSNATWGYVFKFILSMIFAPVMIIASKILGKEIGIK